MLAQSKFVVEKTSEQSDAAIGSVSAVCKDKRAELHFTGEVSGLYTVSLRCESAVNLRVVLSHKSGSKEANVVPTLSSTSEYIWMNVPLKKGDTLVINISEAPSKYVVEVE